MQRRELVNRLLARRDNDVMVDIDGNLSLVNIAEVDYVPDADKIIIRLQPKEVAELLTFLAHRHMTDRRKAVADR